MDEHEYIPPSISDQVRERDRDFGFDNVLELQPIKGGTTHKQALETIPEESAPQAVLLPILRGIDTERVQCRTDLLRELGGKLPLNEYNLPLYIYRADMLDWQFLVEPRPSGSAEFKTQQEQLNAAVIYLNYHQGFPTLKKDSPFWAKLEYETRDAFDAFLNFLQLDGAREISRLEHFDRDMLYEWYNQNYWKYRAQAYDLYQSAHHTRLRERRIFELNDKHFKRGEKIFDKIAALIDNKTIEDWESLDIKEAVDLMTKVSKLQRDAVAVEVNKGEPLKHKVSSIEKIMHDNANVDQPTVQLDENSEGAETLQKIFDDPDALAQAQELIIKVNR